MTDYAAVLLATRPGSLWTLRGDAYDGLVWDDSNADPKPSEAELDAAWPQVQADLAWESVRRERDRLLSESDWTQVADAPVDAAVWAVYRQALRDVPQDYATPDEVVWPIPPA